ncbi:MAG: hypothetical protein JRI46_00595, partial [Deltaproteobacteria bacterium]|nr:hypothetical protein [Deltaproteobacteria bacterium]
ETPFQVVESSGGCVEDCGIADFDLAACTEQSAKGGSYSISTVFPCSGCEVGEDLGISCSYMNIRTYCCDPPDGPAAWAVGTDVFEQEGGGTKYEGDGKSWGISQSLPPGSVVEEDDVTWYKESFPTVSQRRIDNANCVFEMIRCFAAGETICIPQCGECPPHYPPYTSGLAGCFNFDIYYETFAKFEDADPWEYKFKLGDVETIFSGNWAGVSENGSYSLTYCDRSFQDCPDSPCGLSVRGEGLSGNYQRFEWNETSWGLDGSFSTYLETGRFAILIPKLVMSIASQYKTENGDEVENEYTISAVTSIILRIVDGGSYQDWELASSDYSDAGSGYWSNRKDSNVKPDCYGANPHLPERMYVRAFHWYKISEMSEALLVDFGFDGDYHAVLFEKEEEGDWTPTQLDAFENWVKDNGLEDYKAFLN